jgi:hypothetical protein
MKYATTIIHQTKNYDVVLETVSWKLENVPAVRQMEQNVRLQVEQRWQRQKAIHVRSTGRLRQQKLT